MVRVVIRGGTWSNVEDELLKLAVMKYGKHNWGRISSLLPKKSAKQCKARWDEWLDPKIKKLEWSREEEEKLLHLAKLMPTQWRTIAPLVGRTAIQCIEKYDKLLAAAAAAAANPTAGDDETNNNNNNNNAQPKKRGFKAGEIDTMPETRPARPDTVDMAEDELEMISEARARLANTQGKKAKRKLREKVLEETRRLSHLQKQRELRAAGLGSSSLAFIRQRQAYFKRAGLTDYNVEIPFKEDAPGGVYDVSAEAARTKQIQDNPDTADQVIQELRDKAVKERKTILQNKKALLHGKRVEDDVIPASMKKAAADAMNLETNMPKRVKLTLPQPQLTEKELKDLVDMGYEAADVAADAIGASAAASIVGGSKTATSIIGGSRRNPSFTNNNNNNNNATNNTKINLAAEKEALRFEKQRTEQIRKSIAEGLSLLPAPQNEYALAGVSRPRKNKTSKKRKLGANDDNDNDNDDNDIDGGDEGDKFEEDAGDVDEREHKRRKQEAETLLAKRSAVIKRGLPRPLVINSTAGATEPTDAMDVAAQMVWLEMVKMLQRDALAYPMKGLANMDGAMTEEGRDEGAMKFTDAELAQAKELLQAEMKSLAEVNGIPSMEEYTRMWTQHFNDLVFLPSQNRYANIDEAPRNEIMLSLEAELDLNRSHASRDAKRAAKTESKINILTAGYQAKAAELSSRIAQLYKDIAQAQTDKACFNALLQAEEKTIIPQRLAELQNLLEEQRSKQAQLQQLYQDEIVLVQKS